jgi:3-dehydro-L-gulonate 2-dehydrogenase
MFEQITEVVNMETAYIAELEKKRAEEEKLRQEEEERLREQQRIEEARLAGKQLPVPGGYDEDGNLSTDPAAIEKTWRVLPMGYWKGSGLSILFDLIATVLTNANAVHNIGTFSDEVGLSQILIAIDPSRFNDQETTDKIVDEIISDIKSSVPVKEDGKIFYPGEREMNNRRENTKNGIPVNDEVWEIIRSK